MSAFFPRDFRKVYPVASRAKGIYIWDSKGKRYIDAAGGAAVVGIGHGAPAVSRAVAAQMKRISFAHTSQFLSSPALQLSQEIVRFAGGDYRNGSVYLCSGGSEAVETAVKLARAYHVETGHPERRIIISRTHSYHGATLGCLNYGGHRARRGPYEAMLDRRGDFTTKIPAAYCYRCPWNLEPESCDVPCADSLELKIKEVGPENVSAFVAEPISGASFAAGVPSGRYWPRIREICDRYGVLLIADEVMTGFGRLGRNFGLDRWRVGADLVALGKGIASGYLPLGAVLASESIWRAIYSGSGRFEHGFTNHGHPVACAAGLAVLKEIKKRKLVENAFRMSKYLRDGLLGLKDRLAVIGDVRGLGLLWGIEFVQDRASRKAFPSQSRFAANVRSEAFQRGLIVYPGSGFIDGEQGDHILLAPPLVISVGQIREILRLLEAAIRSTSASLEFMNETRGK